MWKDYASKIFFGLFNLMAWIGTCVTFGGALATFSANAFEGTSTPASASAYYDHLVWNGESGSWSAFNTLTHSSLDCEGAGKGLVAMMVFAFLTTLATLVLFLLRITQFNQKFPALSDSAFVISVEFALTAVSTFFFFLGVCIWGGACFTGLNNAPLINGVEGTGFAFIIFNFLTLLFFALPLAYFQHKNAKEGAQSYAPQNNVAEGTHEESAPVATGGYGGFQNETQATSDNPHV